MRKAFWIVTLLVLAWVIGARIVARIPASQSVNTRSVEEFLNSLTAVSAVIGLISGAALAWICTNIIRHRPKDRGGDFSARVAWWGLIGGCILYVVAGLALTGIGGMAPFEALGPADRIGLIVGYVFQVIAPVALLGFLVSYAVTTRLKAWGGQRALVSAG